MNRLPSHPSVPARLPARRRSVAGGRRPERGIALLIAIALIALITAATLISLRAVSTESVLQGQERRQREALFAAQAGIAEGRDWVRSKLTTPHFTPFLDGTVLGARVDEPGLPSDGNVPWFQVIPWTPYTLDTTPLGTGVDPNFAGANREMNGPDGARIAAFPTASGVRYRVFLVDDDDGNSRTQDNNSRVWLVSVGEVAGPPGSQPYRSIIRSLITPNTSGTEGPPCHELNCEDNGGS